MAEYKIVDSEQLDSDLSRIAESIRVKAKLTDELDFPEEFISAVNGISAEIELKELINITSNGEHDVSAFAKALVNVSGQYYVSQWKPSANTHTVSFNTGFEPKLFIITSVNNVLYDTSNVYYVAALWHCSELTGDGYGQYSGGLTPGYGASSRPQAASYDARSYYSYSNGVVSINDATHYFRSGLLYRVYAMA